MSRRRPAVWLLFGLALLAGVAAARPQAQQLAGLDTVAFALAHTQLPGPLGQWLELAGELRTVGNDDRDVLASTARRDRTERRFAIKVELIP